MIAKIIRVRKSTQLDLVAEPALANGYEFEQASTPHSLARIEEGGSTDRTISDRRHQHAELIDSVSGKKAAIDLAAPFEEQLLDTELRPGF